MRYPQRLQRILGVGCRLGHFADRRPRLGSRYSEAGETFPAVRRGAQNSRSRSWGLGGNGCISFSLATGQVYFPDALLGLTLCFSKISLSLLSLIDVCLSNHAAFIVDAASRVEGTITCQYLGAYSASSDEKRTTHRAPAR